MAEPPITGPPGQYWGTTACNLGTSERSDGPAIVFLFENAMTMLWDETRPIAQAVYCGGKGYKFRRHPRPAPASGATSVTRPGATPLD